MRDDIGILEYCKAIAMYFFPFSHHSNLPPLKRPTGAIQWGPSQKIEFYHEGTKNLKIK
jgi:hypothetical protein